MIAEPDAPPTVALYVAVRFATAETVPDAVPETLNPPAVPTLVTVSLVVNVPDTPTN